MTKTFIKDGVIESFEIAGSKVIACINTPDGQIFNPTLKQFADAGWEEYTYPEPEPYIPSIEELVEQKMRERYTLNKELSVLRRRDSHPDEFAAYNTYADNCITWAYSQPHLNDDGTVNPGEVVAEEDTPRPMTHFINHNVINCFVDNDTRQVPDLEPYKSTVYPNDGMAIRRSSVTAIMGNENLPISFGDDALGRPDYASYINVYTDHVRNEITISCEADVIPVIVEDDEPRAEIHYINYNVTNCYVDNDVKQVRDGEGWKTTVYGNDNAAIRRDSVSAYMGKSEIKVEFGDDVFERPEYASYIRVYMDQVIGDIMISCVAE